MDRTHPEAGWPAVIMAAPLPVPSIQIGVGQTSSPAGTVSTLEVLALLTVLTLAPSILIMMTSFTRIVVVLSFVRSALGMQQTPPSQVLVGLALFMTFFTMAPAINQANQKALQPYLAGTISQAQAYTEAMAPFRDFMLRQTRQADLALFMNFAGLGPVQKPEDLPNYVIIPAFAISELKTAFEIGFVIFIPFLLIDMIVASTLMSMGMLMIPPMVISLPFKILLFVMVDGWHLVVQSLLTSFH